MAGADQSAAIAWKPSYNPWLIAMAVMVPTFMEVIDTSIASVALPYIAGSVSATTQEATWVLTSYLVANAIFLPSSTWFSQKFGRKRFLIASVILFTAASFACGMAPSLGFLLVARAIQGRAAVRSNPSPRPFSSKVFHRKNKVKHWAYSRWEWWLPPYSVQYWADISLTRSPGVLLFTSTCQSAFSPCCY